ncbi:glycoside hydrolase family 5 protein [Rhizobium sp. C4]|uniref:glycoside hydrolase family 5 protein n=1 Tax=Rhizobium sp. C4 TaxID=1349800 RepID=UPI001E39E21F|nr:glycoside hydrolase family 5 protein [Rhizobium sp. C4]MCD2173832.1 glycoside hydrolase family 5 protein [Rhizobium sp. C4]
MRSLSRGLLALLVSASMAAPASATCFRGINLSGAEFNGRGARINVDYTYPSQKIIDYFASKKLNTVRLPILWERLQPVLNQPFDPDELGRLKTSVDQMRKAGLGVIIDPHNFATYNDIQIGTRVVSYADFADFWRRVAAEFGNRDGIYFGLMNEPFHMPATQWLPGAQAAIDAIRETGAKNLILVPGVEWTSAREWAKFSAAEMIKVTDPGDNFAYEFHQYLDSDFSGTHAACDRAADALKAIGDVTEWMRTNKRRGFLGEFGGSGQPECLKGIADMVGKMNAAKDVWLGWTYWVAGDWWPATEINNITPTKDGDRPQLASLLGPGLDDKSCAGF